MKAPYIPLVMVLVVSLFMLPVFFGLISSSVPGWHITAASPKPLASIQLVAVVALFALTGYWLSRQPATKTDWGIFVAYLLLTIPGIVLVLFPRLILPETLPFGSLTALELENLIAKETQRQRLLFPIRLAFLVAQLSYFIYCIRGIWLARQR
ncbi:hypothetical protein [Filimonas effusa]|uniref:DUF1772 domain-containing protein n=1 Tax=Filimonas effusa TaxID=2508721 RepID=A0A4Q1D0A6_9BACT|nr:hypothetical protein [Filimonas effusa]RXK81166.1 hypothetical protein ESB13_19700 [Filimonas effusa]